MTDEEIMKALAEIEGWTSAPTRGPTSTDMRAHQPLRYWSDFGPLMEKHKIDLECCVGGIWRASIWSEEYYYAGGRSILLGQEEDKSPRRAGCLAIVRAFGKEEQE